MDDGSPSIDSVRDVLKLPQTTDFTTLTDVKGLTTNEILGNARAREYTILGITPAQFMQEHGGDLFDYEQLKSDFKKICKDYDDDLSMDEKSRAVQFCSKMIYTVGPESRSVKQKMGDKTWIFKFPYNDEGSLIVKAAFVCTFKNEGAKYDLSVNNENRMVLSVRHASLLAIEVMNKITDICVSLSPPTVMLTPLCGAIFSRNDIPSMVSALNLKVSEVVRMLNSSCQSGGHYLKDSELAVAALASIVATSKLAAKGRNGERHQIITKVIKQYLNHKKAYTASVFTALSRFATGGVPTDMEPSKLIKIYNVNKEIGKVSKLDAVAASRLTEVNVAGSRLAGQIYDAENDEYSMIGSMGVSAEGMDSITLRDTQEEEMIRQAMAERLVIKKYRPNPEFKTMIYTQDSERKLIEFAKNKGLGDKIPLNYLEDMYYNDLSRDYRFVAAQQARKRIEHEIGLTPVTGEDIEQQFQKDGLVGPDEIDQQAYRQEEEREEGQLNSYGYSLRLDQS